MIGKKVLSIILSIFFSTLAFAQQVSITGFTPATYGNGGNITVPISLNGCFALNNQFNLYLSDASGDFTNATLVGSYPGFYTRYINGVIPAGTAAGAGYKVRITSTNPATSVESGSFSIAAASAPIVPNPLASSSNTINDSTFGRCLVTSNQVLTLQSTPPAGYSLSAIVKDSLGNNVSATVTANQIIFTMIQGNYYTVKITFKNNVDNTISERTFLVLATNNNLSLQTSGATDVCLPDTKGYTINITGNGGIKNNYPGTQYSITWGDGVENIYTQCELIAREGLLLHDYLSTSCGQPPISDLSPVQYNAYRVNVRAKNDFCPNSFTAITTYSKVWQKPIADFINPVYGCINTPIKFPNTSQAGLSGYNNVVNCIDVAVYEWYVDGVLIFGAPKDLIYTFTTTGYHTVRLVASNDPCSNEITKQICIEEPLKPNFKINGQDSLSGCAPLTVNVDNLTTFDNSYQCRPSKWIWNVLLRSSMQPATLGVDYTIQPNDSATNPSFTFLKPGEYFIRLAVANSCGTNYKDLPVTITDIAGVSFNVTTIRYCGTKTIDFGTDPNHRPVYNSNSGNETYNWTITGGSYAFVGGTSSTTAYPKIQFNDFATYTITVQFQNSCGTKTATQQITFDEPVTTTAINDTTICNNTTLLQLNASYTGPVATGNWSIISGSGSLSDPSIPNPTYTFSNGDRTTGTVTLRYTANPAAGSACGSASDDVVITLLPKNIITSTSEKTICTGSSVNYKPLALTGSTYSWTSTVIAGSVTGNTANGTGVINDVLTNNSTSINGVVKYTITPLKNGCNGEVFNLIVTILPTPDLQVTPITDTICTGTSTNISLSSSYTASLYKWTATLTTGTVTGFVSQVVPSANNKITQILINTGNTLATVTYTITAAASDTTACDGETKTVTVVVRPGATVANAGADQLLCNQSSTVLNGNDATVGVGVWKQVSGPSSTIVDPNLYNTAINGLSANNTYKYVWTISGVGQCPSTSDTVTVAIRPASTVANAGTDMVVCDFVTTASVKLNGNADTTKSYENHYWTIISQPTNGNATLSDSTDPASTFSFNAAGVYKLVWTIANDAGCSPTKDTVIINVFDKPVAGPITGNTNICVGSDVSITLASFTGNIKKWQYNPAPVNDNIWKDTLVTASTINFFNVADSFAVRVIIESPGKSFGCTSTDTSNVLIINATPKTIPGTTGPSATVCKSNNNGTVTLSGNNGKIVRWEFSIDNGTTWTAMVDTATSIIYNNLTVTTLYRAIVQIGNCGDMPSSATAITVLNPITQAIVGLDQLICSASTTLQGNAPAQGESGKWSQLSGPNNAVLFNDTASTVTASSLIAGTYQFVWTLSNGVCAPTSDTINVVVRPAITVANAGNDMVVCAFVTSASVNLNANNDTTRPSETHVWTILSQPTNGYGVLSNPTNPASTFTFNALGTYQLVWTITNDAGCPPTKDTVTINVFDKPVAGPISGNTNICVGNSVTINLASHTGNIKKWQYNPAPLNDNIWKDTLVTASSITFNNVADTFAVRVIVESSGAAFGCAATDTSNTLIINAAPLTIPGATGNSATVCKSANNGTITLTGNTGKIVRWESSIDNGNTWIAMVDTASSVTYKNLAVTTLYRAIVQSANCGVLPSSITTITVLEPVTQALVGADQLICSSSTTLEGNSPVQNEKGQWSQISGPNTAVFSNDTTALVTVSSLTTGTYKFVWTLSNASCPSTSDTVTINVRPAITAANAGNDIVVCDFVTTGSISLHANTDTSRSFENHQWSILSQPNNGYGVLSNPSNPSSTFGFSATGTYQLVWTITNDAGCPPTKDTVTINVFDKPVAGPISGNTNICVGNSVTINLASHTGNIKKWQYNPAPINDNIWKDTLVTASSITFNNVADTFAVRVIVESSGAAFGCAATDTSNTLIINAAPLTIPGTTGNSATVCKSANNGTITLTGNTGKIVRWEYSVDNGNTWIAMPDTTSSVTYKNLAVTTLYRAIVQSANCGVLPSTITTITVLEPVTQALVGADQLICSSSTTLEGNAPVQNEKGQWSQLSGPNTAVFSNDTTALVTVSSLTTGTYKFVWTLSNASCPSTSDTVTINVRPAITVANAGNDIVVCDFVTTGSISLHANTDTSRSFENHQWSILSQPNNGYGVLSNSSNPSSTFSFSATGTYQLVWTITNDAGCPPTKDTVTINVYDKPSAGPITAITDYCGESDVVVSLSKYTGAIKKWQYNPAPLNDNIWRDTLVTNPTITFLKATDSFAVRVIVEAVSANNVCTSTDTSNTLIINITPSTVPGTTGPGDSVCYNNNSGTITLKGNVGAVVRWEFSQGANWNVINDTSTSITYTNLTTTTYYRAIVQSGQCGIMPSSVTVITVFSEVTKAVAGPDQLICGSSTQLSGNTPYGSDLGTWNQISGPNTATLSSTTTPSITAYNLIGGRYLFVWSITNGVCSPSADTVTVDVRPAITPANAGNDTVICNFTSPASINLHGSSNSNRSFESTKWIIISKPSNSLATLSDATDPNAIFNYNAAGTYQLEWTITNDAGCTPTKDTVTITVVPKPVAGLITANPNVCYGTDVVVTMGTYTGIIKKWQYNPAPINDNIWIDTVTTSANINFINVKDTFSVRAIVESNGAGIGCYAVDTSNTITVNVIPATIPGTTGPADTVCKGSNNGSVLLKGNNGRIIRWEYSENNGSTWSNINDTTTAYNYVNLVTTTLFRAIVESGNCGSIASTATTITVLNTVTAAAAGLDQNLCAATSATLNGNNPASGETVSWSQIKGSAVAFSATNIPNPVISNLQAGTYSFVYTITNNVCPATADTVNITINPAIVNVIDTVTKTICEAQTVTITGQDATGGNGQYQYQWQSSIDGFNWSNINGETNRDVTIIAKASIYLRRLVNSLPCSSASNPVHINVQVAISNNTIASDQSICINTPAALLNGSLPAGATGSYTYEWQQSIDSGKTWITIPNAISQNYDPGVLKATTSFRRNVTSGTCIGAQANTSNVITVVINPDAKASFTYSKDTSCPPFNIDTTVITTNIFNAGNGSYNWYANNKFIGNGAAFPGYVLANGNDSVTIKLITVSSFGCKDDTLRHKFYTRLNATQPAFTLSNTEGCGPLTVNITNQTPNLNSFTYKWNFGNGLTSTLKNPGNVIFRANPNYGDTIYTVSLTVYSACDSITTSQDIKVRSAVQALFKPDRTVGCSPMTVTFTNYSGGATDFTWNFDDGTIVNTTQTGTIQHTFTSAIQDTFRVSLIARSQCGNDTQYYSIVISPNNIRLLLTVNGNQKFGCSPHSVQLINNSKGATSFRWDFGDGNVLTTTRNIDTITHEYILPGTYTVKLEASNNCSDTATTETVTVYAKPVVNFSLLPATVCIGDSIRFTNLSDTITGLSWNFGDGTFSNLTNPTHKYSAPGVYTVSLIGIRQYPSGSACIDSASKTATIVSSLPGSFSMSDSVGSCTPFTVTFTNNSLPSKQTVWDFGDGQKDSGNVVKHTYLTTGSFNVTMIATHPGGCNYQDTKKVVIKGPTGSFVYDNAIKCDNSPVRFEATTSGVDSVRWSFGDGTSINSTNNIVYHVYPKPGNYVPTVELFAGTTCRLLLVGPDTIRVDFIKAGFTQTSVADCGNTNISFRDTSRAFTNVLSCAWKFGDGASASIQNPAHNYKEANTWTVQLISTSKYGCVDTATHPVTVALNNVPIASIISDSAACANSRIAYSSSVVSKDTVLSYRWNFTNGYNSNGTTANNVYANAGTYKATLIVSTINGCIDTVSKPITVYPAPAVNASADQTICLGQSVQLNATGGSGYSWGPLNNLSCVNCSNPIANPVKTTRYTVSAFNSFGCMGVDTVTISIAQPFKIKSSLNDTLCIGETTQIFANGADKYKWSPSSGLSNTDVADPIASPSITTRYRVIGSDSNNCFTDTAYLTVAVGKYPTVKIGDDKVLSAGSLYPFTPIVTNGPIVKWEWTPAKDLSCNNCETPKANIKKDITYSVNVTNDYGCTASDTMNIKVFCESAQVFIPNVFTPDGDGVNDVLMVRGSGINTVKLFRIFNRWGEVVFEKSNFSPNEKSSGWDGTVRGTKAPTDVYVYTCEVICENGNSFVYKGNVAIIK